MTPQSIEVRDTRGVARGGGVAGGGGEPPRAPGWGGANEANN